MSFIKNLHNYFFPATHSKPEPIEMEVFPGPETPKGLPPLHRILTRILSTPRITPHLDLQEEKEKHLEILQTLNGSYYEDPNSPLKQAWDQIVVNVSSIHGRTDLDDCLDTPEMTLSSEAKAACNTYLLLEVKRDASMALIKKITALQKTESEGVALQKSFLDEKEILKKRQKELCGEFYEDPSSLLDQAWKLSQVSGADQKKAFDHFLALDEERKKIESRLHLLETQISQPPSPEKETLTSLFTLYRTIELLEGTDTEEELLEGRVDWRGSALHIHQLSLNRF